MAESVDCSDFCRLCLVKEQVNTPIFEELGDLQQIYIKITACLPIKVSLEDPLPKRICDECSYKLDQQYNFWNTSINAEKQLRQWLGLPEEPPTKSENVSGKIKREKDNYESPSKRPRRNARRKAAQHVRQAAAAAIAASDSGPGEDMDLDAFTKEENDSDNDFHDNNESMEDSTYANVGLDSEEHGEAGPSGLQKGAVTSTNSGTDAGGPGEYSSIKKEDTSDYDYQDYSLQIKEEDINTEDSFLIEGGNLIKTENDDYINRKCDICNEIFQNPNDLLNHRLKIHGRKGIKLSLDFTCDECGNKYTRQGFLEQHKFLKHSRNGYRCDICNEGFLSNDGLQKHKFRKHSRNGYRCDICNEGFLSNDGLQKHYTTDIHKKNEHLKKRKLALNFTCDECGNKYTTQGYLDQHKKQRHTTYGYRCDICNEVFQSHGELHKHYKTDLHKENKKIKENEQSLHSCDICGLKLKTSWGLILHKKKHATTGFQCRECSKGFPTPNDLLTHKKTAHAKFCSICKKEFPDYSRYKVHHREVHDPNYSGITCNECGKKFKTKVVYNRHVKSHVGFTCYQCGKMFGFSHSLKSHMLTHTGEKPFSCTICDKKFRRRLILKDHLRTHTKERPFICSVCGKGFTQHSPLKLHMRIHTGERPYKCMICSQGFISKNNLNIHMKKSHDTTDVQLSV